MRAEDYNLSRADWECLINQWIFNEKYRAILCRRLLDGITYEQLAEEFDMSPRQIKNICYKSQSRLFSKIQ